MNILIDTGFWFAFYDDSDQYHLKADSMMPAIQKHHILIPYPSLYETINTRFSKRTNWMSRFESLIMSPYCSLVQDDDYKADLLNLTMTSSLRKKRPISLVDMVIRQMLDDDNLKTDAIVTFNPADFYDVCRHKSIIMIDDNSCF